MANEKKENPYIAKLLKDADKTWETLVGSIFCITSKLRVEVRMNKEMKPADTLLYPLTKVRVVSVDIVKSEAIISLQQAQLEIYQVVVAIPNLLAACQK